MALKRQRLDSPLRLGPTPEDEHAGNAVPEAPPVDQLAGAEPPPKSEPPTAAAQEKRARRPAPAKPPSAATPPSTMSANGHTAASEEGSGARSPDEDDHPRGGPSDGAVDAPAETPKRVSPLLAVAASLGDPPGADETLDLLSVRVSEDLRENLRDVTTFLRRRKGGRSSQKRLPEQEVVAMALWLLGDARDPEAMEALGELHDVFHQRRLAAEMRRARGED